MEFEMKRRYNITGRPHLPTYGSQPSRRQRPMELLMMANNMEAFLQRPLSEMHAWLETQKQKEILVAEARQALRDAYLEIKDLGTSADHDVILVMLKDQVENVFFKMNATAAGAKLIHNSVRVLKYYRPYSRAKSVLSEIRILTRLPAHPRIIKVLAFDLRRELWLVMPHISGGTLEKFRRDVKEHLKPALAWHIILQTLEALQHVHVNGFAHGNVGGTNIMLDAINREYKDYPDIVLSGFGKASGEAYFNSPVLSRQARDIVDLGDQWHYVAHMTESKRFSDGTCSCPGYKHANAAFGPGDVVFRQLMRLTSEQLMGEVTCDDTMANFHAAVCREREAAYETLTVLVQITFRRVGVTDRDIDHAIETDLNNMRLRQAKLERERRQEQERQREHERQQEQERQREHARQQEQEQREHEHQQEQERQWEQDRQKQQERQRTQEMLQGCKRRRRQDWGRDCKRRRLRY